MPQSGTEQAEGERDLTLNFLENFQTFSQFAAS